LSLSPFLPAELPDPPEPVVINSSFPVESHHGWKYIAFGPDGAMLVSDDRAGPIYRIFYRAEQ
jgi:glucose/arabinose dehydrogenase